MRWTKRLKWIRASKIIIPIALAISLVFAGFSVYAKDAEFFVLRIKNNDGVNLSLTMNRDLSGKTARLEVPIDGKYDNATYEPDAALLYKEPMYNDNIPDDIARHDGVHSVYLYGKVYAFFSFSFWLVNDSARAVDVDMRMNIDSMTVTTNTSDMHIDEAVRVMLIREEPLLSENSYVVYKKPEKPENGEDHEDLQKVKYGNTVLFESDSCVFDLKGDLGIPNFESGGIRRFTVVIWLEGWDPECKDEIKADSLKMSMDFEGH